MLLIIIIIGQAVGKPEAWFVELRRRSKRQRNEQLSLAINRSEIDLLNLDGFNRESKMVLFVLAGVVLFGGGVALNTWVDRRKFYRRNMAGVEEFASYGAAVAARGLEGLARLGARLCLATGFVLLGLALIQILFSHR